MCIMDYPDVYLSYQMEESISIQRVEIVVVQAHGSSALKQFTQNSIKNDKLH